MDRVLPIKKYCRKLLCLCLRWYFAFQILIKSFFELTFEVVQFEFVRKYCLFKEIIFTYRWVGTKLLRFFKVSHFLERVLLGYIDTKNDLQSQLLTWLNRRLSIRDTASVFARVILVPHRRAPFFDEWKRLRFRLLNFKNFQLKFNVHFCSSTLLTNQT